MDQKINTTVEESTKRPRTRRYNRKAKEQAVTTIDSTEARLNTHEQLCSERYKAIENRMDSIETRMDSLSSDLKELKHTNDKQFSEIKTMLSSAKDEKFKVMVTVAGTIIVSLLGTMGYLITHLK